jgi:hypothetical protein
MHERRRNQLLTPLEYAAMGLWAEGSGRMTTWAPSKRARSERIEAEADGLIRDLGDCAYQEARRREHEASSDAIAEDWALVAKAIARKTGTRVGLNLSTQLAMNTFFVLDREPGVAHKARPRPEPESQPKASGVPTPQPFRIQFMGAGADSTPSVLREDEIRASDVSAAIIAAAIAAWPPHTIALRILDREGHEVFGRQKAAGR